MKRLVLNLYGVGVEVTGERPESGASILALAEDFAYFVNDSAAVIIRVTLEGSAWKSDPPSRRLFRNRNCEVRQLGLRSRWCGYGKGNVVVSRDESSGRSFRVFGATPDAEYELAYVALLSSIGEELDLRGYHRVHALGLESNGVAALVLLPPGGGKSAMAILGAEKGAFRVYSDENPLVRHGEIYPYPVRAALAPVVADALGITRASRDFKRLIFPTKRLYPWSPAQLATEPRAVEKIFFGARAKTPRLEPLPRFAAAPELALSLVVGWGLAQMSEHMLRPLAAARLAKISASRACEAYRLGHQAELTRFRVGRDAHENLSELEAFLNS